MESWYWHKEGDSEPRGPVSKDQLKDLANTGKILTTDKVWKKGLSDWIKASQVEDLFDQPPPIDNNATAEELGDKPLPPTRANSGEDNLSTTTKGDNTSKYYGVGGWLVFFCIVLTIIGPLITFSQMITDWQEAKPAFEIFPVFESALILENLVVSGIVIFGFVTGILIWKGNENGKVLAERYLIIRILLFVGIEIVLIGYLSELPEEAFSILVEEVVAAILREIVFFGIWYSYFKLSKRVANTFSVNPAEPQYTYS